MTSSANDVAIIGVGLHPFGRFDKTAMEMGAEGEINWTYGEKFPYSQKVTYACKEKPLEEALDELFKKQGGLGYVVVSKEGDRRDGWVLLTTTGERGK